MRGATIGEAARIVGVTPKAIRLWEEKGLIPVPPRSAIGYRIYSDSDISTMRFIKEGKALGLTLRELKEVLELRRSGVAPCVRVLEAVDARIAEIDAAMSRLQAQRALLLSVRQREWQKSETLACSGVICHIIEQAIPLASHSCGTRERVSSER